MYKHLQIKSLFINQIFIKMKKLSLCFLVLVSLFFSCQNDEVEYEKETTTLKLEFTYDGVLYSSAYHYSSDSVLVIDDEKVSEVYSKLMENEQLATVVDEKGKVAYYDKYETVKSVLPQPLNTKSVGLSYSLSLRLYEHIEYTGNVYSYSGSSQIDVPSMDNPCKICIPANLNDQISSIIADFSCRGSAVGVIVPSGAVLTIFEDKDYGGRSYTFKSRFTSYNGELGTINNSGQIKINTLVDYVLKSGSLFSHSVRWNDQMSSAKFSFYKE